MRPFRMKIPKTPKNPLKNLKKVAKNNPQETSEGISDLLNDAIDNKDGDEPKKSFLSPTARRILGGLTGAVVLSAFAFSVAVSLGGTAVLAAVIVAAVVGAAAGSTSKTITDKPLNIPVVIGAVIGGLTGGLPGAAIGAGLGASLDAVTAIVNGNSMNHMIYEATSYLTPKSKNTSAEQDQQIPPQTNQGQNVERETRAKQQEQSAGIDSKPIKDIRSSLGKRKSEPNITETQDPAQKKHKTSIKKRKSLRKSYSRQLGKQGLSRS